MLTTDLRTTQSHTSSLVPTIGVALVEAGTCDRRRAVTAAAYLRPSTTAFATTGGSAATPASFNASWSFIVRKPMPKVASHPDRWPLHSTS